MDLDAGGESDTHAHLERLAIPIPHRHVDGYCDADRHRNLLSNGDRLRHPHLNLDGVWAESLILRAAGYANEYITAVDWVMGWSFGYAPSDVLQLDRGK